MNSSHFKTKIIGGKLVTVPVHDNQTTHNNHHQNWFFDFQRHPDESRQVSHTNKVGGTNTVYNARLEAQRNKARAMHQTYHSVLDPRPAIQDISPTNPLVCEIVSGVVSQSRHKLMSTLSSMRRRDPQESGVLTVYDVSDVLELHNVSFNERTKDELYAKYMMGNGMVDYRSMWKFVMDCYAHKDQIDIPTKENYQTKQTYGTEQQQRYQYPYPYSSDQYPRPSSPEQLDPGLHTQLEHQLRQYARSNQKRLETNLLEEMFIALDRFGTGKLLKSQVGRLCQQYLHGVDGQIISVLLSTCDSSDSGLVDYQQLINLLKASQPTYLPPLGPSPPQFVSNPVPNQTSYERFASEEKEILNYITRISSPRLTSSLKSRLNENEAIPRGHAKELEKIGNIGLHLSDFETEVHKQRIASLDESTGSDTIEPERPCTYDLGPRPGTYDLKPRSEENKDEQTSGEDRNVKTSMKLPKTPRLKSSSGHTTTKPQTKVTPTRKKWGNHSPKKIEKWWKESEGLQARNGDDNVTKGDRRTWGQSSQIKTIKGKRKRKLYKLKNKTNNNQVNGKDSENLSSTDLDSEAYTTTDIEIDNVNNTKKHFLSNVVSSNIQYASLTSGEEDNAVAEGNKSTEKVTIEDKTNNKEDEKHLNINTENIKVENGEVEKLTNTIEERMKLESFSPTCEKDGTVILDVNGRSHELFPTDKITRKKMEENVNDKALQLQYIYGFDDSVLALSSNQCVFTCGRVAVVMDTNQNNQRFFRKHTKDITCCSIFPDEKIVATAQQWDGKKCIVYIWSAVDMATISCIYADTFDGVVFKKIIVKKNVLLSLVENLENGHVEQHLCMYNINENELLGTFKVSYVTDLVFHNDVINIATYGKSEIPLAFYRYESGGFVSQSSSFGTLPVPKVITSALFHYNGGLITGDSNGTIYLWLTSTGQIDHVVNGAHTSSITAMCLTQTGYLLTGSKRESSVKVWNVQLKECMNSLQIGDLAGVHTLSVFSKNVYVATTDNNILKYEMNESDDPFNGCNETRSTIMEGHSDVITGFDVDPVYKEMMTSLSADGSLHTYNTETKSVASKSTVKGNGSCICYHPTKEFLFVGCQDGSVHILASVTGSLFGKFKDVYCSITVIKISPDGCKIACGSSNGCLLIYSFDDETKTMELLKNIELFTNASVKHIDWTIDGHVLRVESTSPDIQYYDVDKGTIIKNRKDLSWSTKSCSIVYEKKDLWENDLYKIERSVTDLDKPTDALALASREIIALFQSSLSTNNYGKVFTTSGCICSKTPSNLRFSCSGENLYMSYHQSGCLWQWKIAEK